MRADTDSFWGRSAAALGPAGSISVIVAAIGLVAYTDWQVVTNISVGDLYLLPLALAGITLRHRPTLGLLVLATAGLREWLGPFEHSGLPLIMRSVIVLSIYALVVFFAGRLQANRQHLAEGVSRQRDQFSRDLQEAAALQRLLIPNHLPEVPGWDLAAKLYPARIVAGDFFDVFWDASRQNLAIVIADVAGKGVAAAMLMPVVQATVRRLRLRGDSSDQLAASLNDQVATLTERPRFVSLVYLDIECHTGCIEYVNMGHPPPILVGGDDESTWRWLRVGGPIAGAGSAARYEVGRERLEPGQTLLLYTDGASEAEGAQAEPFSERRLAAAVSRNRTQAAETILEAICGAVDRFRADEASRDDMTLMVIRRRPGPAASH